ncbi:MAG: methyltransferase domain-containing protein [Sulfitobacter sp.]
MSYDLPRSASMPTVEHNVKASYHGLVRHEVLKLAPQCCGNVLDVGGGIGASSAYLKATRRAHTATVIDLVASDCMPEIDQTFSGDLEDADLFDQVAQNCELFDVILCLDVLEHLTDPWAVIDRLSAMLAPGGCIIASIPNVRNYRLVVPLVFQGKFDLADSGILDRTHLRWFVKDTAKSLMSRGGLRVECCRGFFEGPKKKTFNLLTLGVFRNFLTIQYYIRAVKLA